MALLIVGIGLLGLSYNIGQRTKRWQTTAQTTTGRILTLTRKQNRDVNNNLTVEYYADIQFNAQGTVYQFRSKVPNAPAKFAIGNPVPVYYNQNKPQDARLSASSAMLTTFLGIIGGLFTLVGIGFLL